jgi:CRISPR-associated endonuclease Cas2
MGKMETEARTRRKWGEVRYALLSVVALSGLMVWAAAAPNTLQLLKYVPKNKFRFAHQTKSGLSRMIERGEARMIERKGTRYVELTDKGMRELLKQKQKFGELGKKKRRWDKRWRVVIFDIPEKNRSIRNRLTWTMRSFGFYRLQDSVWVYPYDCEDVLTLLKAELHLGNAVIYMIVEHIENDQRIREEFTLS